MITFLHMIRHVASFLYNVIQNYYRCIMYMICMYVCIYVYRLFFKPKTLCHWWKLHTANCKKHNDLPVCNTIHMPHIHTSDLGATSYESHVA